MNPSASIIEELCFMSQFWCAAGERSSSAKGANVFLTTFKPYN